MKGQEQDEKIYNESYLVFYTWVVVHRMLMNTAKQVFNTWIIVVHSLLFHAFSFSEVSCISYLGPPFVLHCICPLPTLWQWLPVPAPGHEHLWLRLWLSPGVGRWTDFTHTSSCCPCCLLIGLLSSRMEKWKHSEKKVRSPWGVFCSCFGGDEPRSPESLPILKGASDGFLQGINGC